MAVGSKGSFATVNPDQGIIDIGGMARREADRQSKLQGQSFKFEQQKQKVRNDLSDKLSTAKVKPTGQKTFDDITYAVASDLKEKRYGLYQEFNKGNLTLPEMRAKAATYEREIDNFATNIERFKQGAESYVSLAGEGKLSGAIDESEHGEDGFITAILDGKIESIGNVDGVPTFKVKGKEMTLADISQYLNAPPLSVSIKDEAEGFSEDFVSRVTKRAGALNKGINYFATIATEGLDDNQRQEIRDYAESRAKDPKFVGDLWFQATGEKGVYTPDDLTEEQLSELTEWTKEEYVKRVENRFVDSLTQTYDLGEAGRSQRDRLDRADEARETEVSLGKVSPINVGQWTDITKDINDVSKREGVNPIVTTAQLAGAVEIPILNENASFRNLQLSDVSGSFKDYNNVTVKGVAKLPNGEYLIRGSRQVSEGGTVTRSGEEIKRSFKRLNTEITQEDLDDIKNARNAAQVEEIIGELSARYSVSEPQIREAVKTTDKFESFNALVPEPQQILPTLGISEEQFMTQQSVEQSTKPTFD